MALTLLSCDGPHEPGRPLLDADHVPDVLVERDSLSLRPTHDGNRFLDGWWPSREGELVLHANTAGARIELVHLDERPRTLALDLASAAPAVEGRIELRTAGRELGRVPFADPLILPLPGDLPRGRVTVEIIPGETPLGVRAAALRPVLPAGEARIEDDGTAHRAIVQSGDSALDLVRPVLAGTFLRGRFVPPAGARPEQSFELEITDQDDQRQIAFSWRSSLLSRLRGARRFEVSLPHGGFVRLRFTARGGGPMARWEALELIEPPKADPQTSSPPPSSQPDLVVLYVMDALRADAVGHFGGLPGLPDELRRRVTPVYDRLARQGEAFHAHRSVAPNTLPSTKALLTGQVWTQRGGWKLPADGPSTLAERFLRAGSRTALFSANVYVGRAYGVERGFEHVTEIELSEDQVEYSDTAERLHAEALRWLDEIGDEPAFLYIHTVHPHNPYAPPAPLGASFTRDIDSSIDGSTRTLLDVEQRRRDTGEADRERLRRLYLAGLRYNDRELGRFLQKLGGTDRQTFLALTSDHGEELFDHGGILHGYTLYEEMIRIPLVLWAPELLRPAAVHRPTSTLDLHATLAALADQGAAPSWSTVSSPPLHFAAAASVRGGIFSAQSTNWKLIWAPRTGRHWGQGGRLGRDRSPEYLFDLRSDPGERHNLTGTANLEAAWLRSRLRAWIDARAVPEEGGREEVDDDVRRRLEALGYVD